MPEKPREPGRYHVLVHEPPAGLGGTGLADDRAESVERAKDLAREIRATLTPEDDPSFVVAVDDQQTGETVYSTENDPQTPAGA